MKAIETVFRGYKFRSRLEARWAVFFDELGLKWEYEPEGFDLGDGVLYLPDFRVTSPQGQVTWYEVKPEGVTSDKKFERFKTLLIGRFGCKEAEDFVSAVLLSGDPVSYLKRGQKMEFQGACPRCGTLNADLTVESYGDYMEYPCFPCDMNTPSQGEWEDGVFSPTKPYKGVLQIGAYGWQAHMNRVARAALDARSARFEHGERERMARA